jgi:hypothetical protein
MQQAIQKSPFLKLDRSMVIGYLKSTGSRDPDVLHTQKSEILSAAKFPKMAGVYLMVLGGLMTMLILTAFIGIPLLILGWWMRRRGVSNVQVVDAAYAEYLGQAQPA